MAVPFSHYCGIFHLRTIVGHEQSPSFFKIDRLWSRDSGFLSGEKEQTVNEPTVLRVKESRDR